MAVLLLLTPTTAAAQEDGVTYDPDSPAGRQYGLPLADAPTPQEPSAKKKLPATAATPTTPPSSAVPADDGVVLFGAGIEKDTTAKPERAGEPEATTSSATSTAPAQASTVQRAVATSGQSSVAVFLGVGALVLAVGLVAALALRSTDQSRRAGSF